MKRDTSQMGPWSRLGYEQGYPFGFEKGYAQGIVAIGPKYYLPSTDPHSYGFEMSPPYDPTGRAYAEEPFTNWRTLWSVGFTDGFVDGFNQGKLAQQPSVQPSGPLHTFEPAKLPGQHQVAFNPAVPSPSQSGAGGSWAMPSNPIGTGGVVFDPGLRVDVENGTYRIPGQGMTPLDPSLRWPGPRPDLSEAGEPEPQPQAKAMSGTSKALIVAGVAAVAAIGGYLAFRGDS